MEIIVGKAWEPKKIVSTGSLLLDSCIKFGGIPTGSIVQYFSPPEHEGSMKTTLGMCGLAALQKEGIKVAGIDTELTPWDKEWLEGKGLKINKKLWAYVRPTSGEEAIESIHVLVEKHNCKGILFDSVEHARPKSYRESEPGDANTGIHAKLMRQFWQTCKDYSETHNVTFYVINNTKSKIGYMPWDKGETVAGGQASTYSPTINVRMRRPSDSNLEDAEHITIKVQIKRSKVGGSWKKFETYFVQGLGIDRPSELLILGQEVGLFVPKNKSNKTGWISWHDKPIGKDFIEARNWVFDNEKEVIKKLKDFDKYKNMIGL